MVGKIQSHVTSFLHKISREDFICNFNEFYNRCQKRISKWLRRNVKYFPDLGKNILEYVIHEHIHRTLSSFHRYLLPPCICWTIDLFERPIVRKDFKVHGVLTIQTHAHFQLNPTLPSRTSEDKVLVWSALIFCRSQQCGTKIVAYSYVCHFSSFMPWLQGHSIKCNFSPIFQYLLI